MFRRKPLPLGGWLLLVLFALGYSGIELLSNTSLLWHGVTTRGVIVGQEAVSCGRSSKGQEFSVQFTDQAGQTQIGTISQCEYDLNASPGESVTIFYLPDNPAKIAPPGGLNTAIQNDQLLTISAGLITLVLLLFWIRKRMRKASLQDQPQLIERTAEQIQQDQADFPASG